MRRAIPILFAGIFLFLSCEEGTPFANNPPDTRIFLDEIDLSGQSRLNSIIKLHWSGEDEDGYVKGYELSFDAQSWFFTSSTDSTFRFDIPLGSDSVDVDFFVRAIDNNDLPDPEPAFLRVPIKNTAPTAVFDVSNPIPELVYSAWSVFFFVDDTDGVDNLDSSFVKINDGPWIGLDKNIDFLTFVPVNSDQEGLQEGLLYAGLEPDLLDRRIEGLEVGGDNQIFLRARDISGEFSEIDSSNVFQIRKRGSDLLIIDAHGSQSADAVYLPIFEDVYPGADYLDLLNNQPPFWSPTFEFMLEEYDKVFWYSDDAVIDGDQILLEIAANQLQGYLNQGGKLFVSAKFPGSFNNPEQKGQSLVFGFSPMDSLSSSPGQARISTNSFVFPTGEFSQSYDTLVASSFLTGVDAFYPKDPSNTMYQADLISVRGWTGPSTVVARSLFTNGQSNQVFVGVELHKLNQNPESLASFIGRVLLTEFDW